MTAFRCVSEKSKLVWCEKEPKRLKIATMCHFFAFGPDQSKWTWSEYTLILHIHTSLFRRGIFRVCLINSPSLLCSQSRLGWRCVTSGSSPGENDFPSHHLLTSAGTVIISTVIEVKQMFVGVKRDSPSSLWELFSSSCTSVFSSSLSLASCTSFSCRGQWERADIIQAQPSYVT